MPRNAPMAAASLPAIRERRRPGTAIVAITATITAAISSSVRVKPLCTSEIVLLHVIAERPEAHTEKLRGLHLHAAGAPQRFGDVLALDLLHVLLEIEALGQLRHFVFLSRPPRLAALHGRRQA